MADGKSLPGFARSGRSVPLAQEELQAVIRRVTGRTENPDIAVHDAFDSLPPEIQQAAHEQGIEPEDVEGVHHQGMVHLVRSNIGSAERAEQVLFHERWHQAAAGMFRHEITNKLSQLYYSLGGLPGIRRYADRFGVRQDIEPYIRDLNAAGSRMPEKYSSRVRAAILANELLAHIAQQGPPGLRQRALEIIGSMRQWLRDRGFMQLAQYNDADIAHLLRQGRSFLERRASGTTTMFSRKQERYGISPDKIEGLPEFSRTPDQRPPALGMTGTGPYDFVTFDRSPDLARISAEMATKSNGKLLPIPIRLEIGSTEPFGQHRGRGWRHIQKEHGHELKEMGVTPAQYLWTFMRNVVRIFEERPGVIFMQAIGEGDRSAVVELRRQGDYYFVRTLYTKRQHKGTLIWNGPPGALTSSIRPRGRD